MKLGWSDVKAETRGNGEVEIVGKIETPYEVRTLVKDRFGEYTVDARGFYFGPDWPHDFDLVNYAVNPRRLRNVVPS